MTNIRNIVENTLVPHSGFESACARLEQCFSYAEAASEPIGVAVVGESRTGKSRALEECYAKHAMNRLDDGLIVPILRVKTPSKPTVKSLAELMLYAMHDPKFTTGTENVKTARLRTLMRNARTRMVMIDEFQHFYDKGSHKVMHHVADWLKILVDDSNVALVVAGLPTCQAVLEQNEQLAGRFFSPIIMPRFDWENDEHRDEFIGILGAFQESLGEHFDLPALDGIDMGFRCYCATGGLMGYLTKFLRQAVWNALDAKRKTISLADLANAYSQAIWRGEGTARLKNPFNHAFLSNPNEELLATVREIGVPKEEALRNQRRLSYNRQSVSVQQILSAR